MKIVEGISYYPCVIYYLEQIDKNIPKDKYKPVSYDQWLMLKELEPSKFGFSYKDYIKIKKEQFNQETEQLKDATLRLQSIMLAIDIRNPKSIQTAKDKIKEIESGNFFDSWPNKQEVDSILNLTI
jgi:hypothetical protein